MTNTFLEKNNTTSTKLTLIHFSNKTNRYSIYIYLGIQISFKNTCAKFIFCQFMTNNILLKPKIKNYKCIMITKPLRLRQGLVLE